jgi:hypothetical protein
MGLTLEGQVQEARLHGDVLEDLMEEGDTNGKIYALGKAMQSSLVQMDGLTVRKMHGGGCPRTIENPSSVR